MLSPRRVQSLFLTVTLLFAAAVGWLGWELVRQDRALARQRRVEQLEAAADRVAGALFRRIAELEELSAGGSLPPGVVRLRGTMKHVDVEPAGSLLYLPFPPPSSATDDAPFALADLLEFQREDSLAAARALEPLTRSPDAGIRAAAMLRLGRNLRKAGRENEALRVYAAMSDTAAVLDGLPAELAGLEARCALLASSRRLDELRNEAKRLTESLIAGRWPLTHAAWESQYTQAKHWLGEDAAPPDATKSALSAAAETLLLDGRMDTPGAGQHLLQAGEPVLALWRSDGRDWRVILASADSLHPALEQAAPFAAVLLANDGPPVAGSVPRGSALRIERSASATKLPWTLEVSTDDDGSGEVAGRMWLLGTGFTLLVALLCGVSVVVARAVAKQMEVARLQADFVAAVSHEFRSPLSAISQIAELLREDRWPSDEHRRKGYDILSRESARLRRLVEGLLDFARIEAGKRGYPGESLIVGEFLRELTEEFRESSKGAVVALQVVADLPPIKADREALRRAVWNLLENAVKYSPAPAQICVEAEREGSMVAIRVRDQGFGIPASDLGLIFQRFYRGGEAKQRGLKGTGIGLALVKQIVEGHGGEVCVESMTGSGSTFTILLPEERTS